MDELRASREVRVEPLEAAVVQRQHVVLRRLVRKRRWSSASLSGSLVGEVMRLRPVVGAVELPDVVVERRHLGGHPRDAVPRHRSPPLVVDAAVAEHLEVLGRAAFGRIRVVERVGHRDAVERHLLDAVDGRRARAARPRRARSRRCRSRGGTGRGSRPWRGSRRASGRSSRCACRPSAMRSASSTGTERPSRAPSRPRSGCRRAGVPKSSIREAMNSTVSSPTAPFRMASSLKQPFGVPSAEAPLSPTM